MPAPVETAESVEIGLNPARQAIYRFASLAFLDPRAGAWSRLRQPGVEDCVLAAAELLRSDDIAASAEPGLGEFAPAALDPAHVLARLPRTSDELNAEYEATFGLLVSSNCPPYETEYIDSKLSFQRSQELAEIAGYYKAFGLQASDRHRERQDHIALELEFMAVVISLETRAAARLPGDSNTEAHRVVCRQAQSRFLEGHLAWWLPTFARLLGRLHGDGFYARSAELLAAFLPIERALLGVGPRETFGVRPYTLERPEQCEGCLLQP